MQEAERRENREGNYEKCEDQDVEKIKEVGGKPVENENGRARLEGTCSKAARRRNASVNRTQHERDPKERQTDRQTERRICEGSYFCHLPIVLGSSK